MRLVDHVVEKLLALVQARSLQPGQRLPAERALAAELGVSRSSLREAIQKLASQGVLAARQGDGTYLQSTARADWLQEAVAPLVNLLDTDPGYRFDVIETRHALETATAELAAQRATAEDKDRIRRAFDVMIEHQQSGHTELAARSDAQFHLAIAEASHNLVLKQLMHGLFSVVLSTVTRNREDMFRFSAPETLRRLSAEHQAVMLAIVEGDAPRARTSMVEHLEHVRQTIQREAEDHARRERLLRLPADAVAPLLPPSQTSPIP